MKTTKTLSLAVLALFVGITPVLISAQDSQTTDRPERPRMEEFRRGGPGGPGGSGEFGGPGGPRGHQKPHHDLIAFWEKDGIAEALELDQTQIDQLDASLDSTKASIEGEKEILKEAMDNLRDLMEVDNPDLDAVYAALDEISASKTVIAKAHTGHRVAVKNILTAEQEEILKDQIKDRVRDRIRDRVRDGFRPGGPEGRFGGEGFPPAAGDDLPDYSDAEKPLRRRSKASNGGN